MFDKIRNLGYRSLSQAEEDALPTKEKHNGAAKRTYSRSFVVLCCVIEAFVFAAIWAVFADTRSLRPSRGDSTLREEYLAIHAENTTQAFTENGDMMDDTPEAEAFWEKVLGNHGIVSVPTDWALDMGFAPSSPHPDVEGHSIYQVDVFHSLHCLHRVRTLLVSNSTEGLWTTSKAPGGDGMEHQENHKINTHTLHCIDYVRQQLLCHADLTLQGTQDFLHYSKNNGYQCKDYNAVNRWINKNAWVEHHEWLFNHYNLGQGGKGEEHGHGHEEGHGHGHEHDS